MRRVYISDFIKQVALQYSSELLSQKGKYQPPSIRLQRLYDRLANSKYKNLAKYVDKVKTNLTAIVILQPKDFDVWCVKLNMWKNDKAYKKAMSSKISYNGKKQEFYKHMLDAMRYDRVQSHIMPKYIEAIGVKTCVYCNSQYAVSTEKIGNRRYAHYELDHFKPKSQYPFLCVSFFNLQPSCSNCNKHKSSENSLFGLYTEDSTQQNVFTFRLSPSSIIKYQSGFNSDDLEIQLDSSDVALLKNHEDRFHISKVYPRFKKEASEILWRKKAYNPAFISQMLKGYSSVFPNGKPDIDSLYWGHDMNPDEVHQRPLNKLAQDLNDTL